MSDDKKWPCSHCTYLNYENALKCTMCGISKAPTIVGETGFDIYQIAERALTQEQGARAVHHNESKKWTCLTCTYLNYERAKKCTQCQTKKTTISDQMATMSIDDSIVPDGKKSPQQASAVHNDASLSSLPNLKWRCRGCTYENWPRTPKCIMCNTPKGLLPQGQPSRLTTPPPPPLPVIGVSDTSEDDSLAQAIEPCTISVIECDAINKINKMNDQAQSRNMHSPVTTSRRSSPISSPTQPANMRSNEGAVALNNYEAERIFRHFRRRLREADWTWLNACMGVVDGDFEPVQTYLASGGDPMRQLTSSDIKILARPSAFDEGYTLVHLAIRFGRDDLLATILSRMDVGSGGVKRMPSYVAPDLAQDVNRYIATSMRQRKGPLASHFFTDIATFSLPADLEDLPSSIQDQLFEEILDKDAQKQLEEMSPIINWSLEITERLGSRLYCLWNRTAGDCLLDSLLQASWGVFDRDGVLRRALADSLAEAATLFYPRWKEYERSQARLLNYYMSESQMLDEWTELLCLSTERGAPLEQLHIFALAHIFRRPIIVYGVKNVKSFRGEDLGYARFEGVYLPLLWENSFCWKSPLSLAYTRGHFCALVPMEPDSMDNLGAGAILDSGESQVVFLPLMTHDGKLLPVHFLNQAQVGYDEEVLRTWLNVCVTEGGILVAQQHLAKPPLNVAQMVQEWLNHYRRLAQMECAPFSRPVSTQGYSSDGDSEEE